MEKNNLYGCAQEGYNDLTCKYVNVMLKAVLAWSTASIIANERQQVSNNVVETIMAKNQEICDTSNKMEIAKKILSICEQRDQKRISSYKVKLATIDKFQVIEVKNNTTNTSEYHIVGLVSNHQLSEDESKYLLIDMLQLRPLYNLNENKEIINQNDDLSYTELGFLSDYLLYYNYIKREYNIDELKGILNIIREESTKEKSFIKS